MKSTIDEFLREIEREKGRLPEDLHITRMCCALTAVSNGEVIKVREPLLKYCPLSSSLYGFKDCDQRERIAKAVKDKISEFGHFTKKRELYRQNIAIPYGTSEMMMYALKKKGIEATVTVCDGAGTVIAHEPGLVQGIGARMNGVFYTSPINEIIHVIRERQGHIVFPKTAKIDQIAGLRKAVKLGFKNIAVTVNGFVGEDLSEIKKIEKESNTSITTLVVCTSGISEERAREIKEYADLAWSCASLHMRELVGKEAIIQIATKIPVFVLTRKGINFMANYSADDIRQHVEEMKKYIISGIKYNAHNYKRIRMGNFDTYLMEIDKLPFRVENEPKPLI